MPGDVPGVRGGAGRDRVIGPADPLQLGRHLAVVQVGVVTAVAADYLERVGVPALLLARHDPDGHPAQHYRPAVTGLTGGCHAGARCICPLTTTLPISQRTNSATAGTRAQPNCCRLMSTVPSNRWNTSIWVTSTATMNSPNIAQFICLLSKVAVVSAVSVSLRHSAAATIRHSANAVNAIELPMAALWKWDLPSSRIVSRPMVMASPARETVMIIPLLSTDAPRRRGRSPIRPG